MRVLFFGDSITQGFWDTEGGWVQRLRKHYDISVVKNLRASKGYPSFFNLGISGDTTTNLLKRVRYETEFRKSPAKDMAVLIAIGTNDDALENHSIIEGNLEAIIEILNPLADNIILVGNTACDERETRPVFWADMHYTNADLRATEQIIETTAKRHDKKFVPVFEHFKQELDSGRNLLADGLHPNNEGHQLIADLVQPILDEVLTPKAAG